MCALCFLENHADFAQEEEQMFADFSEHAKTVAGYVFVFRFTVIIPK
jgi:hypothetical protein